MKIRFFTVLVIFSVGLIACDKDAKTADPAVDRDSATQGLVVSADWKLRPGQWEIRTRTTADGRAVAAPARTICVETPAALSERAISFDDGSGGCRIQTMRQVVNKITYSIGCPVTDMTAVVSTLLVDEDAIQQTIKRKMGKGDNLSTTETTVDYRHLGPCMKIDS